MSIAITSDQTRSFKKILPIAIAGAALIALGLFMSLTHTSVASATTPAQFGLHEGDRITANNSAGDPDIYIINDWGYMRLILNPAIASFYGHLGTWPTQFLARVKQVTPAVRDAFTYAGLFRNCEANDQQVWAYEFTGEDTGVIHKVTMSGDVAVAQDPNFFKKVFCINNNEFNWFSKSTVDYTNVNQIMTYHRGTTSSTPTPVAGSVSVSLAVDSPVARTVTTNAQGVEFLKTRFSGSGTITAMTYKRTGPGSVDDFDNVYIYDGARRLVAGKSISSSTGEVTFTSLNLAVSGTRDITFVGDLSATAGNVNAFQLTSVTLSSGTVGGLPLVGNNVTVSGATSGTITQAKVGSLGSPNAGQANVEISEFKLTANTEAASVRRIQMLQGGTVRSSDITNIKLQTSDGTKTWTGTIDSAGYLVFDMGSGYTISKGGNTVFKVYADVAGKKSETIALYFEYATDILAIGDQYGYGMAVTLDANMDDSTNTHVLTLQGGVLTLTFAGPTASDVGTNTNDSTFLLFNMAAASNIEVRKTRIDLALDLAGDGTFEDLGAASMSSGFSDLDDIKLWDIDSGAVISQADGSAFTTDDTDGGPSGNSAAQKAFTDVIDLSAGQTRHMKITADVKTANTRTGTDIETGSKVAIGIDDYSDNTGVTESKYAGTNTALAAADIVPNANINGPAMTVRASGLTLSLAASPADQTVIKGRQSLDTLGIVFAAANASSLKVSDITLTGYSYTAATGTFVKGSTGNIANMVEKVWLVEKESGNVIASSPNVNNLATTTGTVVYNNLNWVIPAGTSKTLLVRVNLSSNDKPSNNYFGFDIAATTDVTATDDSSSTVNAGNATPNSATSINVAVDFENAGSMTMAAAPDSPVKGAVYWGQVAAPISKFRLTSTNEGQYIEKFTIATSVSTEKTVAAANVKTVKLTYKNKNGDTLTKALSFEAGASANFGFTCGSGCTAGSSSDTRPYVPKDSSLDLAVAADMNAKGDGSSPTTSDSTIRLFSLDISDTYNGSFTDGFRAVGDGSGSVLDGTSTNIQDKVGAYDQYVYRVFPKIDLVALSSPYNLIGTPDIFKFTVTAMGLTDSKLFFDNQATGSGSIKFEILASGTYRVAGTSSSFTAFIGDGSSQTTTIDTITTSKDAHPTVHASMTLDFTSADVEITGGLSKTIRIQFTNPNAQYGTSASTGRSADWFQLTLLDDESGLINWVPNSTGSTGDLDVASTNGVLRNLPLYGPTFQR